MIRKGCAPRLMLEALAAAGGSLSELRTGGARDDNSRSDLMRAGLIERVYVLTDAGRDALAHADDPAPRMPRRAMPRIDPARIATAELAAMWHGYPPITDPSEIQKLRDSLQ
jgi:hypothetical protein